MDMEKILFLDIDGVLQPAGRQERFAHIQDIDILYDELTERLGVDYRQYDKFDVAAVYFDWDKGSVFELRRILMSTGARIVVSSDWRSRGLKRVADFLRIHDLDEYVVDCTLMGEPMYTPHPIVVQYQQEHKILESRAAEILVYLAQHPEIQKYLAVDDMKLDGLGENVVQTNYKLEKEDADKCIALLGLL
ncbi:hypothetical protein FACS1894163_04970 [Spirochaetia bacterium]|nr:hypothetical protein FACS1894163_04970 [Spirochaetia bacterium]